MLKFNIEEGTILSEVKQFELNRGSELGRLCISVHKVIAGGDKLGAFAAIPNLIIKNAYPKYSVIGNSEEEVLTKCLDLIKGVPTNQIINPA